MSAAPRLDLLVDRMLAGDRRALARLITRVENREPGVPEVMRRAIRSPRTAPPVNGLVGSTATTLTVAPVFRITAVSRSTSVLFPAPGGPVMPTV